MHEIKHEDNGTKGRFYAVKDGQTVAETTYTWAGKERFIIDHTDVDDSLRGLGIGKKLVMKAVEMAREKGVMIIPLCPFAKSVFERVESIRDVL